MTRPILVTGADGRLGRAVWRVDRGRHLLVRPPSRATSSPASAFDIVDAAAVDRLIAEVRPRAVIHLASMVGASCEKDPQLASAVNVLGTCNLASAAVSHGVERIVFASTAAVYGTGRRRPVSEQDPVDAAGVYALTKLRAEEALRGVSGAVAVDAMRIFNVYGPGMTDSLVTRLAASNDEAPVQLRGLDGFVRDYIHVDDVARALLASADSESVGGRIFNVGSGTPRSNRDLFEALPAEARASVEIGPELESYSCADITAIVRDLSWGPREPWPPFGR